MHCDKFLIVNQPDAPISQIYFGMKLYVFQTVPLSISSGVFHCTHSNVICHIGLLAACEQDQDGTSWSCKQAVSKPVWHIPLLCVQWKTPDGQRNFLKQVEFHFKINLRNWCIYLVYYKKSVDERNALLKCVKFHNFGTHFHYCYSGTASVLHPLCDLCTASWGDCYQLLKIALSNGLNREDPLWQTPVSQM